MIYFISNGTYTKIGKADDPEKRLKELQTGCPEKLEIKLVIDGGEDKEKMLHKALNKYRYRGEWFQINFKYNEELIEEILYFHRKLNREKRVKRKNTHSIISEKIELLKKENKFITANDIADIAGLAKITVSKNFHLFKEDVDKYNISVFNTDNYNTFVKSCNIDTMKCAIESFKEELEIKITKKKVSNKSNLHINTVYNLWNEEEIQKTLDEYNNWITKLNK